MQIGAVLAQTEMGNPTRTRIRGLRSGDAGISGRGTKPRLMDLGPRRRCQRIPRPIPDGPDATHTPSCTSRSCCSGSCGGLDPKLGAPQQRRH